MKNRIVKPYQKRNLITREGEIALKKKLLLFINLMLVLALLAACGGQAESPENAEGSSGKDNTNQDPVEISFLYQMDDSRPQAFWDEVIAEFEDKNPGITVKGMTYPNVAEKQDYIKTLYSTGQMPDVTFAGLEDIKLIDGVFLEIPEEIYSIFDENAISKDDGKVYTLPTAKYIMLDVFYNKDIFAEYNLSPPKTWDEFLQLNQTLKDNGVTPLVEAGQGVSGYMLHNPMMTVMLNEIDPDYPQKLVSGEMKFNGPDVTAIAERFQSLWDKSYYHEGSLSFTAAQKTEEFMQGSAAMMIDGQFSAGRLAEGSDFTVGWFPLPGVESAEMYPVMYGDDVGVHADTKHPEEALKLVEFLFTDEVYKKLIEPMGATHTTKKEITYEQDYLNAEMNDIASELTPVTVFTKIDEFPSGTTEAFRDAAQDIAYGGDVKKALDQMESTFRKLLESKK